MSHLNTLVLIDGDVASASAALGVAQRMRAPGEVVGAVLIGLEHDFAAASLGAYGVDEVWIVEGGDNSSQADFLSSLVEERSIRLILSVDTEASTEILARIAALRRCAFAPGCIRFERTGANTFSLGRPCLQGGAYAEMQFLGDGTLVASINGSAFWAAQKGQENPVESHLVRLEATSTGVSVLEEIAADPANLDLSDADLILAGGAGMGSKEAYELLASLAAALGGVAGASRVAVDRGWAPRERQIGQTGRTVAPRVYVAWGISGAVQHLAGIRGSQTIVAVNNDPEAPIFRFADVEVLADAPSLAKVMLDQASKNAAKRLGEAVL